MALNGRGSFDTLEGMQMHESFMRVSVILFWAVGVSVGAAQKIPPRWERFSGQIQRELSRWDLDPEVLEQAGIDAAEVTEVQTLLLNALESGNLEDLAPLRPSAEQVLEFAESRPGMQSYAAWLRQRLDYFQVADEVIKSRAAAPSLERPKQLTVTEVDYHLWYDKIQKRNPPARASSLVPVLKRVFRREGVPEEFVWLAEVESSFNPSAESPAGACGLYQFMPATAGRFGLSIRPKDERLDPYKSARAAAQYLAILHRTFGDWQLALAAYNAGEGRVGRLLKSTGGATFDDIAMQLPAETRMYVPKMRAVVQIREGVDLRTL